MLRSSLIPFTWHLDILSLFIRALGLFNTDFLFSPIVLMMILPLFLLLVLPKMINDPDTKKELESISFLKINNDMPEIREIFTSFFTGAKPPEKQKPSTSNKQDKKRN
uniref:ER membrane protein complex subunit 7 beta-sandwich domain-containing protein n=1 Tax=Glossina austeni TaxID=7395 RepID=A0A1A9UKX6_GLOAU